MQEQNINIVYIGFLLFHNFSQKVFANTFIFSLESTRQCSPCVKLVPYNLCKINRCEKQTAPSDEANELNVLCKKPC